MGISTAPDEYQVCVECILGDLQFIINVNDHLEQLRNVFERLRQYDVTNTNKCRILRDSVDYFGFTLTPNGV
ncbi:K02A2.6-like protein [Phytophthora palmivora]|uniref:K02A2.6-like protein n=1 Tax=Phytophthora palmivora TaxID=4796 RepID=A0A2P4XVZ0_9STRA|nr:K02A2.6-like protein [Phytophthora palmivora]